MISQTQFLTILTRLWPNGDKVVPGLRGGMVVAFSTVLAKYGITDNTTLAQMMAQFSHECDGGLEMWENLNYSEQGLIKTWPKHFDIGNAGQYAHNPRKIANYVYEPPIHNDLGNRPGTDDGWLRRGRGLSQITGLGNDQRVTTKTGIDLVNHPELACDPNLAFEVAIADFVICGCLPFAKADDVLNTTKHLNGGTIGLDQRKAWLSKWKNAIANMQPDANIPTVVPKVDPTNHGTAVVAGVSTAVAGHQFGLSPAAIALLAIVVCVVAYIGIKNTRSTT
jgi:putative chitinase